MSFSYFKNNVSFVIALKPSLAGEGLGEEALK